MPPTASPGRDALTPSRNPIRDNVTVSYSVERSCLVSSAVYDAAGNRVADLGASRQSPGPHGISWNSSSVRPGVYVLKLQRGSTASELRLVKAN